MRFSIDLQYEKLKYIKHTISCYIEKNMKNKFEKLLNSRIRKEQTNRNGSKNTTKKRKGHWYEGREENNVLMKNVI